MDIQLSSTIAADTGTGALMKPYRLAGDTAVYREASPVAQPSVLSMKREEPKPTKDYSGAGKTQVKYTRLTADASGRLWPLVYTINVSLPAFLTDAQKSAFVTEGAILSQQADVRSALAVQIIPQS